MALAIALMVIASRVPIERAIERSRGGSILAWLLPAVIVCCMLVYVPGVGRTINGAARWVSLQALGAPSIGFQPSELAKWAMPIVLAWHIGRRPERMGRFFSGALPALVALGGVAGLVAIEDFGTGALIAAAGGVVLLARVSAGVMRSSRRPSGSSVSRSPCSSSPTGSNAC